MIVKKKPVRIIFSITPAKGEWTLMDFRNIYSDISFSLQKLNIFFITGIKFFYKRALQLLANMFNMEEDYIIGTFLHPNYKQLRGASNTQITDCYSTCRQLIHHEQPTNDIVEEIYELPTKKTKPCMSTLMDKQKNTNPAQMKLIDT